MSEHTAHTASTDSVPVRVGQQDIPDVRPLQKHVVLHEPDVEMDRIDHQAGVALAEQCMVKPGILTSFATLSSSTTGQHHRE